MSKSSWYGQHHEHSVDKNSVKKEGLKRVPRFIPSLSILVRIYYPRENAG